MSDICPVCGEDWSKGPHWHPDFEPEPGLEEHIAKLLRRAEVEKLGRRWYKILTEREG